MEKLYLIGNAHLDPVWLWQWQEGFSEILATYRSALDRMKEFPDFKFTSACAAYYRWVEEMDPAMFEEIRQRVAEGRWGLVGGWWIQPDCNLPDGESFARHALISQRYFREKFGQVAQTGYNVDSFGHNASLPQILRQSGMKNYVFMRPSVNEGYTKDRVFEWESPDGSRVKAFRIPDPYCITEQQIELFAQIKEMAERDKIDYMAFYGVGNHGGGPTIRLLNEMHALGIDGMVYATPDEYFEAITNAQLPVIRDELQHHARGCYSANSSVKAMLRKCESNLLAAEALCVLAQKLTGAEYPHDELERAWKELLFNQFHDIAGGCSIQRAYPDAMYAFGEVMHITERLIAVAMQRIAGRIDTQQDRVMPSNEAEKNRLYSVDGAPIVLFNPHTWPVKLPVQLNMVPGTLRDPDGNEVPYQQVRRGMLGGPKDDSNVVFLAEIPALGYAVYRSYIKPAENAVPEGAVTVTERSLENNRIRVEFSEETGDVCRIVDKKTAHEWLNHPCQAILLDETQCDTWAHDRVSLGKKVGAFGEPVFEILESGPIRAVLRVTVRFGESILRRDYILAQDMEQVQVKTWVNFREKHRTLKFTFPHTGEAIRSRIPYGTIDRPEGTGEEPGGMWFATGSLCVASDSKYAYDAEDGELRMTVLRNCIYADHSGAREGVEEYMEMGAHEFTYALYPFQGNADAERRAKELNFAPRCQFSSYHKGDLPQALSGFACNAENVIVTAVKQAEDSNKAVVRAVEMEGREANLSLRLFGSEIRALVGKHQVRTWLEDGTEYNFLEWKAGEE